VANSLDPQLPPSQHPIPGVADDPADVITNPESLRRFERHGIDREHDGVAGGTVLGDWNPHGGTVESDAAGMIAVAVHKVDVAQKVPLVIQNEHVADASTRRAPWCVRQASRFLGDLDRREKDAVSNEGETLRVVCRETERDAPHEFPACAASVLEYALHGCQQF